MEFMKKVSFIFYIHLPNPESLCKLFEDNKICTAVVESDKFLPRKNILLLSIVIPKDSYKRRLFGYFILVHENKQRTYSLSRSTKHYVSIYK